MAKKKPKTNSKKKTPGRKKTEPAPVPSRSSAEFTTPITGLYEDWFLDYASYVILDRAVPYLDDGLKPVQRRILHAMKDLDDGRFNKVANVIGHTMQYHPHGDAAIGDAMVNLGQKDLLIETQGNWGNIYTGDGAAAPRYIEARLSKFALEVVFNPQTTAWQLSYDGRKKEPVTLPVKFPLVLAQGVEGIAVGLSTKILPHNFRELCEASISCLKGKPFKLYPDFPTGGMVDVEQYDKGSRGGKIRSRARIDILDKKTLVIRDLPFAVTTQALIDSILKANQKGSIKIKHIDDNTARNVEIVIHLPPGINPDLTIDALYAFTSCESPVSPNCCVIIDDHPVFTNVIDVLKLSTERTKDLLKLELEILQGELEEKWHMSSLEKIFIENRIYRDIEEEETWEGVIKAIDDGLKPFKKLLKRKVTTGDIEKLTEIKIKRISRFDSFKADELIRKIEEELKQVRFNLKHLVEYAVGYFEKLLDKFGKGRERKTEIRAFETIEAVKVAVANTKLYMNSADGFIGTSLKKDEFVCECSDLDDIIAFTKDGTMKVVRISEKVFVGKNIVFAGVFNKGDDRMVYHMIYRNGKDRRNYVKRFQVVGITRDKEYDLTKGKEGGFVYYFSANPNGESEIVTVKLKPKPRLRKTIFDFDFSTLEIKARSAGGNLISKFELGKVVLKEKGLTTLGGRDIWFDGVTNRLNADELGSYLGKFSGEDRVLVLYEDGSYELTTYELTNRYAGRGKIAQVAKLGSDTVISAIQQEGGTETLYLKRFAVETTTVDQRFSFVSEKKGTRLRFVTAYPGVSVEITWASKKKRPVIIQVDEFIDVKGWKATGNKISSEKIRKIEAKGAAWIAGKETSNPVAVSGMGTTNGKLFPDSEITFEIEDKRGK